MAVLDGADCDKDDTVMEFLNFKVSALTARRKFGAPGTLIQTRERRRTSRRSIKKNEETEVERKMVGVAGDAVQMKFRETQENQEERIEVKRGVSAC